MSAIHYFAKTGNIEKLESLLQERKFDINLIDEDGNTALHWACQKGHVDIVELLLKMGAASDLSDNDNCSPLEIAASNGNTEIVRMLLEEGIDVNHNRNGFSVLHVAASKGQIGVVNLLIQRNANPNQKDNNGKGNSPLHWATQEGHISVVEALLCGGANINDEDEEGFSPLTIAVSEGHLRITELLIRKGANVNARCHSNSNSSPLHSACAWCGDEITRLLLSSGADPEVKDDNGKKPIDIAVELGNEEAERAIREFLR